MTRHMEARATLAAAPQAAFTWLDDPAQLGAHMSGSSMMMGGGRMTYDLDAGRGRSIGSRIRMAGSAFGLKVSLEEAITVRDPPRRKIWRTVGEPKLLVIGAYEMGFSLDPEGAGAALCVWIDYEPASGIGRLFGWLAGAYARWCVGRMVGDAVARFGRAPGAQIAVGATVRR